MRIQPSYILLIGLVATACAAPVGVGPTPTTDATATPAGSVEPTSAPSPLPSASPSAAAASPLEGTWSTPTLTCDQQNAALTKAGFTDDQLTLGGWDGGTCGDMGHGHQFRIRFAQGRLVQFGDDAVGWDGTYRLVDDTHFEAGDRESGGGMNLQYAFELTGDQLTIDMIEDKNPPTSEAELLGEQIAQTVIYESAPFVRDGAGTAFESTIYPYALRLPDGWSATAPGSDEDFFEGPGAMTLKVGSGQPEPGQTVADRVAANRADAFTGCETDPGLDTPSALGGEAAVQWSATCDSVLNLATNTIHEGIGYRLLVALPVGDDAMATATAAMDVFVGSFTFTD